MFFGSVTGVIRSSESVASKPTTGFTAQPMCVPRESPPTQPWLQLMQGRTWDAPLIKELSQAMMDASICGLGQAAPNPVLSVLKYFPNEVD